MPPRKLPSQTTSRRTKHSYDPTWAVWVRRLLSRLSESLAWSGAQETRRGEADGRRTRARPRCSLLSLLYHRSIPSHAFTQRLSAIPDRPTCTCLPSPPLPSPSPGQTSARDKGAIQKALKTNAGDWRSDDVMYSRGLCVGFVLR
jgi:hypothetical protein